MSLFDVLTRFLSGGVPDASDFAHDILDADSTDSDIPIVNPASGLPMINGSSGVDVAGNPYGTDLNNEGMQSIPSNCEAGVHRFGSSSMDHGSSDGSFSDTSDSWGM